MSEGTQEQFGKVAAQYGQRLPLQVCRSRAGFYVGTKDAQGRYFSRESVESWPKREWAEKAIWNEWFTQKPTP
jgi:hypothetical protein